MKGLFSLALLSLCLPSVGGALASPRTPIGALIQDRGQPLHGGTITGGSQVPLERAEGGDTPVLSFTSDQGPVRLLLDTGAASSMVSPALARRLGLSIRSLSKEDVSLAGGGADCEALPVSSARLPDLLLPPSVGHGPPLRLQGLEAFVIPVAALPKGVDGVLGVPSLRRVPFVVDPSRQGIWMGTAARRWWQSMPGPPPQRIPLVWRRGVPLVRLVARGPSVAETTTVDALADTGAEGLFVTPFLASRLAALGPRRPARLVGVCGPQEVVRQRFNGIGLESGNSPSQSVEAIVTVNPVFPLLGVEAIVGQELLRTRRQLWRLDVHPPRIELW